MIIPELAHFPIDPSYGTGAYRRRLVFTALAGGVVAQVDDSFHSYWLILDHDQDQVTGIDAGFVRAPADMCTGSITGLSAAIGCSLRASASDLMARLPRSSNCTHLADLALWAIAHVGNSATWNIEIPDQSGAPVWITVDRDGQLFHRWLIVGFQLVSPDDFAGRPLMGGFMKWADSTFSDDAFLGATMLQRGLFVARGRQHIVDQGAAIPLSSAAGMSGMCWSYSGDRRLKGKSTLGYVRDFTESVRPEALPRHVRERLKDLEP